MRAELLVNLRRSTRRAGKVEHMSRTLALVALTHLIYMHSEHPFMLELASSPLVKLPCSPPRTIPAFGRLARKGGSTSSAAGGFVGSSSARCRSSTGCVLWAWAASEPLLRQRSIDFHAPPCKRCWWLLAAQLRADRMRAGLYARDQHGWKLWRGLLGALGTGKASSRDAAAIRRGAVPTKMA